MEADVAEAEGSEEGVYDGVEEGVGIGVALKTRFVVGEFDAAQPEGAVGIGRKRVDVVAETDADF